MKIPVITKKKLNSDIRCFAWRSNQFHAYCSRNWRRFSSVNPDAGSRSLVSLPPPEPALALDIYCPLTWARDAVGKRAVSCSFYRIVADLNSQLGLRSHPQSESTASQSRSAARQA